MTSIIKLSSYVPATKQYFLYLSSFNSLKEFTVNQFSDRLRTYREEVIQEDHHETDHDP